MKRSLTYGLILVAITILVLSGRAMAQAPAQTSPDARLQELEAKLQALMAEIKSLKSAPAKPAAGAARVEEKKPHQFKVVVEGDHARIIDGTTGKPINIADAGPIVKFVQDTGTNDTEKKMILAWDTADPSKTGRRLIMVDDAKVAQAEPKKDGQKTPAEGTPEKRSAIVQLLHGKPAEGQSIVIEGRLIKNGDGKNPEMVIEATGEPHKLIVRPATPATPTAPATPSIRTWQSTESMAASSSANRNTVMLSRTTYTLPGAKAAALESFLRENAKVKVLETKREGDSLTITTTPDVQSTISGLIALMTDKGTTTTSSSTTTTKSTFTVPLHSEPKKP